MHREGAWTPGGDDEAVRRLRPTDWGRAAREGAGMAAGAGLAACIGTAFSAPLPFAAAGLLIGSLGMLGRRRDDQEVQGRERVLALREEFGLGPVWVVDLMVRQGDAPTGRDQGLMWVEEGRVMYSGLRTSFALAAGQAAGTVRHDAGLPGLRLRLNLELARETVAGPLSLSFWPIAGDARRSEDDAASLRYALNTVLDAPPWPKRPEAAGQWPPVAVGPGAPTPAELRRRALTRVWVWTAVAAWLGLCGAVESPWIGLAAFAAVGIGANLAIRGENRPRWKAYRDALRVWRQP